MARILSYLFEVTERFGMETRTELILLQRTMVVVEGVARSMHPQINIWEVAQPVVASYIHQNVGPGAALKDLGQAALVVARFGPRLPKLVERILSEQSETKNPPASQKRGSTVLWIFIVALLISNSVLLLLNLT